MTNKTAPRRPSRTAQANALRARLANVEAVLYGAIDEIDDIGERMQEVVAAQAVARFDPDTLGCYASNSVQGVLALLRELGRLLPEPRRRG